MKQADIWLKVDRVGSTIPLKNVTPAEVLYLVADNHQHVGDDPIVKLEEKEEDKTRSASEEVHRLKMKYNEKALNKFFGGFNPRLPETFEEARQAGLGLAVPSNPLITHKLL